MFYTTYYLGTVMQAPLPPTPPTLDDLYKMSLSLFEDCREQQATPQNIGTQPYKLKATSTNPVVTRNVPASLMIDVAHFIREYGHWQQIPDLHEHYTVFQIPKASGGLRTIKAPKENLMEAQYAAVKVLEKLGLLAHDAAFAYVKERSTYHAVERHQRNESQWFLKLDLKNFFDNCTPELMQRQLRKLNTIAAMHQQSSFIIDTFLSLVAHLNTLDGGFPQGTPLSPLLTNLLMVPFDYHVAQALTRRGFIYTRYADDLLISHKDTFRYSDVIDTIRTVLREECYDLTINMTKTRYGSRSGANWNLGLMLNKENKITIGHRRKKNLRAMLHQFTQQPELFDKEATQVLLGNLEYFHQNEPDQFAVFMHHLRQRYGAQGDLHKLVIAHLKTFN